MRKLKTGIEAKIAQAFHEILLDEVEHKDSGARSLNGQIKNDADCKRAAEIIRAVCGQRLRMRNEQFGVPLNKIQLAALDRRAQAALDGGK